MFTNLKNYKNTLMLIFTELKLAVYKMKHIINHKSNLILVLYSPPGQIEMNKMCSFPGGLSYHNTMEHFFQYFQNSNIQTNDKLYILRNTSSILDFVFTFFRTITNNTT